MAAQTTLTRRRRLAVAGRILILLIALAALAAAVTVVARTSGEPVGDSKTSVFARAGRALTAAEVALRDRRYAANDSRGAGEPDSIRWVDRTDSSLVVIVAPHAVNHHREGEPKPADLYTGAIAETLANRIGASVLTTTGEVSDWHEKWSSRDDDFTAVLDSLPDDAVIIDLHGMSDTSSPEHISIGTAKDSSGGSIELAERIADSFGGRAEINGTFPADSSYTVTRHMQERGHDALQIEMSFTLRDPAELDVGYTVDALTDALADARG